MAWGSIILGTYFMLGFVDLYCIYRYRNLPRILVYCIIFDPLLLMSYVGMVIGLAVGRDVWHTPIWCSSVHDR